MTVMGMAASQARFLGLTARKSNVEYQGQQINQQRTALSNESANLYSQMMDLTVPTPPSTSDFYKTVYTIDDSAFNNTSNCRIANVVRNSYGSDRYTVKLEYDEEVSVGVAQTFQISMIKREKTEDNNWIYNTKLNGTYISYNSQSCTPYEKNANDEVIQKIEKNKIYAVDDTVKQWNLAGYQEAKEALEKENKAGGQEESSEIGQLYFYQNANGKNCFLTQAQLDKMTVDAFDDDEQTVYEPQDYMSAQIAYASVQNKTYSVDAQATIDSSDSGRYTTIEIDADQEGVPEHLLGATKSISTTQELDENAYNDAYNEYEYQKDLYEQAMSDLNAKTEIVQTQDKQLELRLQQLNTEQKAISTEMEAVQKVVSDNVEKTFKIFA